MNDDTQEDGLVILVLDLETTAKVTGELLRQHREKSGETREQFCTRVGLELSDLDLIENGDVDMHRDLAFAFEDLDNEQIARGLGQLHGSSRTGGAA